MRTQEEQYVRTLIRAFMTEIDEGGVKGEISISNTELHLIAIDCVFIVLNELEDNITFFDYIFNRKRIKFINECKLSLISIQCHELLKLKSLTNQKHE